MGRTAGGAAADGSQTSAQQQQQQQQQQDGVSMARGLDDGSGAMGGAGGSYSHGTLVIPGRTGRMSSLAQREANGAGTASPLQSDVVVAARFGMVTQVPPSSSRSPSSVDRGAAAALDPRAQAGEESPHGRRLGGRIVVDPPDLQAWRERLFDVDEEIVLTNDE